ncbi:heme/hemin ABC transporter substrate-binding protein [Demequina mangrovi]|uniref:Iron complex transport system substrate-binding protein n=1 Tax=Demequina mangrovi TaxID=1043493 RepID=A0A1H6ZGJ4_9MICO|nr:ABC transporter substrate-binding protein [Demequina mangrovi]SEJ52438.1 iron complex transport system substrate-binding protein [Demequina mangrovi]
MRRLVSRLAVGTLALALTACTATADVSREPAAAAAPASGPVTAALEDRTVAPVAEAAVPSLPVTVVSRERAGDREVTVDDASRIVAVDMSGAIAATVVGLGLGDHLVGRDTASEIPGLEDVAVVTAPGHTLTPEAVLALEPTVVVTDGSIGPSDAVAQVRDAGIPVVYVENEAGFDGAGTLARQVADALGVPEAGAALAGRIAAEVSQASAEVAALAVDDAPLRMAFLYLRGSAGVYYMFGDESGADELIDALGGVDAAADAGITGMQPLTDEAMLAADPDVILVMTNGLASVGGIDGLLEERPAIALTSAGRNRRIVDMDDHDILAFGPRSAAIVTALATAVHGA